MIQKTKGAEREYYLPFLATCIRKLTSRACEPAFLLHESQADEAVVDRIQQVAGGGLPVVRDSDPQVLKGILGRAFLVIGSRYHALVAALSQGVPCVATGWSHKYQALLEDYGCPDLLLPVSTPEAQVCEVLERLTDDQARAALTARLAQAAREQKQRTREMWAEVDRVLGIV